MQSKEIIFSYVNFFDSYFTTIINSLGKIQGLII